MQLIKLAMFCELMVCICIYTHEIIIEREIIIFSHAQKLLLSISISQY